MKRLILVALLVAAPGAAQEVIEHPPDFTFSTLPTCNSDRDGRIYTITDASDTSTCAGGGTARTPCICNGTAWASLPFGGGSGHGDGANCAAGEIPLGVDANGAVQGCYEPTEADITDLTHTTDTNANTLCTGTDVFLDGNGNCDTLLTGHTDGTDCASGQYARGVDASGNAELCTNDDDSPDSDGEVPNDITVNGGAVVDSRLVLQTGANPQEDGRLKWDSTTERVEIGDDGVATLELYPGAHTTDTGPSPDCSGTSTYQDGEGNCDAVGGDVSGGLDALVVADNSHNHTESNISDLSHTTDTNANTICTGTDVYLDGEGNCDTISGGGAPTDADYLVGTANASLSAEIVVGTTPGGDLGGTWAAPSVDDNSHNHTESNITDLSHTTDTTLSEEQVEDFAGPMVATGGTKTGITVTYQDATNDMDFDVDHDAATNFVAAEHVDWASASAGTIHSTNYTDNDTQLTEEQVEDFVGGMLGGTETRITVTYQDGTNDIDFVVDDMNDDVPESGDFGNAVDLDATGAVSANAVALGTDTTGNYAAGDAEAGNATGLACSGCVDVSAETNLAAGAGLSLSGDSLESDGVPVGSGGAISFQVDFSCPVFAAACTNNLTAGDNLQMVPMGGDLSDFYFAVAVAPGSGDSWTATVSKNGTADSTLECVISNTSTSCNDTTGSISYAAGDTWGIEVVEAGTAANPIGVVWTLKFTPD